MVLQSQLYISIVIDKKKYFCGFDCMNEICKVIKENEEIKKFETKKK